MERVVVKDSEMRLEGRVISRYLDPVTWKRIPGTVQVDENMVVDTGAIEIVKWLYGSGAVSTGAFKYMGLGSSATAAAHAQTALLAEYTGTGVYVRVSGTQSIQNDGGGVAKVYQVVSQFAASTGMAAVAELGLFTQLAVGGTMLNRLVLSPTRDNLNNAVEYTYQLTVAPT
jgi:hypothetical protein